MCSPEFSALGSALVIGRRNKGAHAGTPKQRSFRHTWRSNYSGSDGSDSTQAAALVVNGVAVKCADYHEHRRRPSAALSWMTVDWVLWGKPSATGGRHRGGLRNSWPSPPAAGYVDSMAAIINRIAGRAWFGSLQSCYWTGRALDDTLDVFWPATGMGRHFSARSQPGFSQQKFINPGGANGTAFTAIRNRSFIQKFAAVLRDSGSGGFRDVLWCC